MKIPASVIALAILVQGGTAFQPATSPTRLNSATNPAGTTTTTTQLQGWFDKWTAGGSGNSKESLDEQWERQQEILRNRRKPKEERDKYFEQVEARRKEATKKQQDMWAWQTKSYGKGEDPLDEWKKRRADGSISNLDDQYGDEKKKGGIPIPQASFGVGGEFGVGGKVCVVITITITLCSSVDGTTFVNSHFYSVALFFII